MDRERSHSLNDVSRIKEVTKRGLVEIPTPRDLSVALGPLGHKWLPPERPSQEGSSRVAFNPRFSSKKTKKKSRIPTLKDPSAVSGRKPSKSQPSTQAVVKENHSSDSSSGSDSDAGTSTTFLKPSMQTNRRPRSAPTSGDKSLLIPPPIVTKRLTPEKTVGKLETSLEPPPLSHNGSNREALVAGMDYDEKSDHEQSTSTTGDETTSLTGDEQDASPTGEEKTISSTGDKENTSPTGDEQFTSPIEVEQDTSPTGDGNQRKSLAGEHEQSTSLTGDGQDISPTGDYGVIYQGLDVPAQKSVDILPSYLFLASSKSESGGDIQSDMTLPGTPSRESSTSQSFTGSPLSSDSEPTSPESLVTSPPPLAQHPNTEVGLNEVAAQQENGNSSKEMENPTEKASGASLSSLNQMQGTCCFTGSLKGRKLSKSHDTISLGSNQRNKIRDLRSCKSFLMLPHITPPSQPELSSSFRQLLHGCHSYRQMPHITDTESDLDFPTVSVMELVKADEAASSDKERLHPTESEASSDEEDFESEGSDRPPSEQIIYFWDRLPRPRSYTAPADLYSTDGQSRSFEVFPRHLSSRIKFDQSLERVTEVPEGDEGGAGEALDPSTEHPQGHDHAHDERRVLVLSKHYSDADRQTLRDQQPIRRDYQEEVLCRWRKREGIIRSARMRSHTYSSGDYVDKDVHLGSENNEGRNRKSADRPSQDGHSRVPIREAENLHNSSIQDLESRLSQKEKEVKNIKAKRLHDRDLLRKESKQMKSYLKDLEDELEGAKEYINKLEGRGRRQSQDIEEMRGAMIEGVTSMYNGEIRELWDGLEKRQANSYRYIAELENRLKEKDAELDKEKKRAATPGAIAEMTALEPSEGADEIVHGMETVLTRKNHEIELLQELLRQKDAELKAGKGKREQLEAQQKELKLKDKQITKLEKALRQDLQERYSEANELIESAKISLRNAHELEETLKASARQRNEEVTDVEEAIKKFVKQKERETRELKAKHARAMKMLEEELEELREEKNALLGRSENEELRCLAEMENRAEMETQIETLQKKLREAEKCVRSEIKGKYKEAEELWEACSSLEVNVSNFHAGIKNELEASRTEMQNLAKVKDELEQDSKDLQLMESQIVELQKENVEILREKHEQIKAMEVQTSAVLALKDEAISQLKQANTELLRQKENYIDCLKLKFNEELQEKEREFANMQISASELLKKKEEQIDNLKAELKQVLSSTETAMKDPHNSCKKILDEKDREIQRLKNCHIEMLRQVEIITQQLKTEVLETMRGKDTEMVDLKQFCHEVFQKAANDVVQLGESLRKELLLKEEELENLKLAYEGTIHRKSEDSNELWKSFRELSVTKESVIRELEESYNGKLAVKDHEINRLRLQSQAITQTKNSELDDLRKQLIAAEKMLGKFQESLQCANEELVSKERKLKELKSQIEDQWRTQQDSQAEQIALRRKLEDKKLEFNMLQETSLHTSESFAKDYRDLQEISSERAKDKDRMISILEAKLQDVVTTKEAEIHRSTVALQNQLAVKDRTIQLLTLSVKEVEDKFKKSSKAMELEKGNLEQVIKGTREKLQSCNLKLKQETENKNSEITRLQKVVEDTVKRTDLQLEVQREKAENAAREKDNEMRRYKREIHEENFELRSVLREKTEAIANLQRTLDRATSDKIEASTILTDLRHEMEEQSNKANNRIHALERENLDYRNEIKSLKHFLKNDEQGMKTLLLSVDNMCENLRVKDKALQSYSRTLAEETKTREALTDDSRRLFEELVDYRGKLHELNLTVHCFQEEKKATVFRANKSEREITEYRNTADRLKQENISLKLELEHLKQQSKGSRRQETYFKDKLRNQTATVSGLRDRVDRLQMELAESEQLRYILDNELKEQGRGKQLMTKPDHSRLTAELEEAINQATRRANYSIGTSTDRLLAALQADETATKQLRKSLQSQKNEIIKLEKSVKENKQREDALQKSTQSLSSELKYKDDVIKSLERTIETMKGDFQQLVVSSERKYSNGAAEIADLKQELTKMKKTFQHDLLEKETIVDSLKSEREILTAHVKYLTDVMKKDEISKKTLEDFTECLEKDKDSLMNQLGALRDELEGKENELQDVKSFAREAGIRNKMLRETLKTYQSADTSQKRQPA